jgi:hypothetical protein
MKPWAADQVERRLIAMLTPYARNARMHSEAHVAQIVASMERWGVTMPILVDEDGEIIAGHGRVMAAEKLGYAELPVLVARGWSDEEKKAYRIADNRLSELSSWDTALLAAELSDLGAADFDLSLVGYSTDDLANMMGTGAKADGAGSLADRFLIPPFSVLNAREGWWQDRKRAWLALGIQSELGRGENALGFSDTILEPDPAKRKTKRAA